VQPRAAAGAAGEVVVKGAGRAGFNKHGGLPDRSA
jgi:hypothetical protein